MRALRFLETVYKTRLMRLDHFLNHQLHFANDLLFHNQLILRLVRIHHYLDYQRLDFRIHQ